MKRTSSNRDASGITSALIKISTSTDLSGSSEYFAVSKRRYLCRSSNTRRDKLHKVGKKWESVAGLQR